MKAWLAFAALLFGGTLFGGDVGVLPVAGSLGGWALDGQPKVFTGSGLYGHIDGGAEIFFEFGFEELTVQRYARGADAVEVELYRMRDPVAALGIYLGRCGRETPDPSLGVRHTMGTFQLLLVQNRYFLIVSNLGEKSEPAPVLLALGRTISGRLPPEVAVSTLELLTREGRVAGSERLIRGPLALQSLITLGDGDMLRLGDTITAVAASYAEKADNPAHALIVAEYPSEAAASEALGYLAAHLDAEIKPLHSGNDVLVFRDYAGTFGIARVAGRRMTITINMASEPRFP